MSFQSRSEGVEGKSRPPESRWKVVPQSRTGGRETPITEFVMCSWHEQLPHVNGVGASAVGDGRPPRGSIMHATQVDIQNDISIGSADFAALTIATHKTDRPWDIKTINVILGGRRYEGYA